MTFEDEHLEVLQNIEFAIIQVYRHQAALLDRDTLAAIDAVTQHSLAETRHRPPPLIRLPERAQGVVEAVKGMWEWRLGRASPIEAQSRAPERLLSPTTLEELIRCLNRIRQSIRRWHKEGGRQGYLQCISQFLP